MRYLKFTLLVVFLFTLSNCSNESDDSCTPISCLNGGTQTVDCGCDCPDGFSGTDCSAKLMPSSIKITNVEVKKFPDTNNGSWWDGFPTNSDADIYITIGDVISGNEIYTSPTYYEDASGLGVMYDFEPETPINITDVTNNHVLTIYDFDSVSDEFISLLVFNPYDSSREGFPNSIAVSNTTGTFECDITLEYNW